MIRQAYTMCDMENCDSEASQTMPTFLKREDVAQIGPMIRVMRDVDLCGPHLYRYTQQLPLVALKKGAGKKEDARR